MPKGRRTVTTSDRVPEHAKLGPGRKPRLWAYGYADLAAALGMREGAVRMAVHARRFDPADLASIIAFAKRVAGEAQR